MTTQQKKKRLRSEADKLWFEVAMKKWNYRSVISGLPAEQVHHFFPKGQYGYLRYDLDNAIPLTKYEHFRHHHLGDPTIHQRIIEVLGKRWYNKLLEKSKNRESSFVTVQWYQDNIAKLKAELKKFETQ